MAGVPMQDDMDLEDPVESLLWALVGIFEMGGASLLVPIPELRKAAQHLWDRGVRFLPEEQRSWAHPVGDGGPFGAAVEWKDYPPSSTRGAAAEAVSRMSPAMREALRVELDRGDS